MLLKSGVALICGWGLLTAEDMANFDSAAGRDELARNGDAQRPHERRVLHAELLGK